MSRKNLKAEVTVRVLGKDLTKAEAEELYFALRDALGKKDTYLFPHYQPPHPVWPNQTFYGNDPLIGSTCDSSMLEVLN